MCYSMWGAKAGARRDDLVLALSLYVVVCQLVVLSSFEDRSMDRTSYLGGTGFASEVLYWDNITPLSEGHWKICCPRAKHYVTIHKLTQL